jgi:two-component system CitB family sensor kinase
MAKAEVRRAGNGAVVTAAFHRISLLLRILLTIWLLPGWLRHLLHCGNSRARSPARPGTGAMRASSLWRHWRQHLSTQVVTMMVAILVLTLSAGFAVIQWNMRLQLQDRYEHQALSVAQALAADPDVSQLVTGGRPGGELQQVAMRVKDQTGALFVVVTNAQGIRYTHPNPALIGTPISYHDPEPRESEPFRTGIAWMGIQHGTLGLVAAGKAPLRTPGGKLAGEVSVGFAVTAISRQMAAALPSLLVCTLAFLAVGVLAALALSRRLKRQTFGLELSEIAALLQEREAMLHGIKEAVLGYDSAERVLLANDAARSLLALPPSFARRPLREMLPAGRLADVVTGAVTGSDLLVLHGDRVLVANRMPITRGSRQLGWVVTFQDRTESESLKRALAEATGVADTLRAQSHEFANRLHTLVGLVELGHYAEAVQFVTDVSAARGELTDQLVEAIGEPKLAALILAKVSLADERDVTLRVMPDSRVGQRITAIREVLTVVGNLVDNAIDAASPAAPPARLPAGARAREVELTLVAAESDLLIRVRDSGPGVPQDMREQIFMDGVTTKSSVTGARRGLGLALVRQIAAAMGGMVSVGQDGGAVFTVVLPGCLAAADGAGAPDGPGAPAAAPVPQPRATL